ncbi:MAG TPA: hypothetical protein VI524_12255 [Anaerolineales bacterium]|nr:hypothetical protein [Anaerolineales bacterium]
MLFNNRRFLITRFALILAFLGGMFVGPVHAATRSITDIYDGVSQSDVTFPTVVTTSPKHGDVLMNSLSSLSVQFSAAMLADGTAFAVNKTTNYLLVEDGIDGIFQTTSCAGTLSGDDSQVTINSAVDNPDTFTSTLAISG